MYSDYKTWLYNYVNLRGWAKPKIVEQIILIMIMILDFNLIIQLQKEDCDILTKSGVAINGVAIARSNLNRKLQAIEDSTYEGREFVFTSDEAERVSWDPRLGDRITTPTLGTNSITEIIPQIALGKLIGYRVRTG